jgi:ABC-type molybdenum transport system ATPase subunit/photorepair protein PhrA
MIVAKEANQQTNERIENNHTKELKTLENLISGAITDGKFVLYTNYCVSDNSKKVLEQLGYKVERGSHYNDSYTSISWENA